MFVVDLFKSRRRLEAENLFLRRQLSIALRRAPSRLPIVFAQTIDPIGNGFIERMSRPGGNMTGFTQFEYVLSAKWLELLKRSRQRLRGWVSFENWLVAPPELGNGG